MNGPWPAAEPAAVAEPDAVPANLFQTAKLAKFH